MKKVLGFVLIALALVIGIVPVFTDCLSQGKALTTTSGMSVPMKCHWTSIAEMGLAVPLGLIGILSITSKRKETFRALGGTGGVLGVMALLFPTVLIGVCSNPMMYCNMIEKPTLLAGGSLIVITSLVILGTSLKKDELVA
jgi:hypothetical protein